MSTTTNSNDDWLGGLLIIGFGITIYNWILMAIIIFLGMVIWLLCYLHDEHDIKIEIIVGIFLSFCVIGIFFGTDIWYKLNEWRDPGYSIQSKKESVDQLSTKLEKQLELISQTRNQYQTDISRYIQDLRNEKETHYVNSLNKATAKIHYNIELIKQRDAYLSKLLEIESVTRNGLDEAIYMSNQLAGAKGMAKVLGSGKSLASDAEYLLAKYGKYTEELVINQKELSFKSSQVIWQQYAR